MEKAKRKQIEEGILTFVTPVTPGGNNRRVYQKLFATLNDTQFEALWESIKKRGYIPLFVDNYDIKEMIDYEKVVELSQEWNIPLEQQLIIPDPDTGIVHTTPDTAVVGIVESCKQRQIISKKIGVSKNDYNIDDLTGQPTGDSKAGGVSNPELNMLIFLGLPTVAKELAAVKGGDLGAYRSYKNQLVTTGRSSTNESLRDGTGVKSLQTAKWLLLGRHIVSTIGER